MSELNVYTQIEEDGTKWLHCPWCGKKYFPISRAVKIKYLPYKCKGCGEITPIVDVGYSVKKNKQIDGQMEMTEFLK